MSGRLSLAKRHVLPKASDAWVGIMYPSESGTRDRVIGPAHLAAASLGIGVPIVTAGILVAALFSPALWTSLPLVMLGSSLRTRRTSSRSWRSIGPARDLDRSAVR